MSKQQITKSELIRLQGEGLTRTEIAKQYGVSVNHINQGFKQLGITTKAKKKNPLEFVDDTTSSPQTTGLVQ